MFRKTPFLWIIPGLLFGLAVGLSTHWNSSEVQADTKIPPVYPKEITSYRDLVKRVAPAVVSIEAKGKSKNPRANPMGDDKTNPLGFGSGLIVDAKGTVLTNFHVIEGAESADVYLPDGRKFSSKDIRGDRKTDLAIIRIQADKPLPYLEFGNSDEMEVGDRVLAIGAPFGLSGTVTHGIISAKSRSLRLNQYEDFLQTDAAINPGNSGGPLISMDGKVIGINSVIKSKSGGFSGIGLAISANLAKSVMEQLLRDGMVKRGYLGIGIRDVDEEIAVKLNAPKETVGVVLTKVYPDAPAAKSGLKVGDIILSIGGKRVRDGAELQKVVAVMPLNQPTAVSLIRNGEQTEIKVTIEEQPEEFGFGIGRGMKE